MKITFLGAAKTVTGSCFLVETGSVKLLVDCGMFQGGSIENALNEEPFAFNPARLDFILLTHAHIDHSGRIPKIWLDGFRGQVIATKATVELCAIMLPDSGHIQEFESQWMNRKRQRAGKPPVKPLYTHQDAVDCLKLFRGVKYGEIITLNSNLKVRFNDAGHMLGSAIIELWAIEDGKEFKVVFSGDLGNKGMPILRDPALIDSADYLVIESTYGSRLHVNKTGCIQKFIDIICDTAAEGGNIIIPSFAVGRTQEIIYSLNKHYEGHENKIHENKLCDLYKIPVYVDSPLAISATEVFRNNPDCFDEEARAYIESGDNPLDFPGLEFTRTADESKMLNEIQGSKIIIAASGMCEAGRIKHHLKHNLWKKQNTVLFVGYQAEGTLGRKLVNGAKRVKILGEEIAVNARIETIDAFSGHTDMDGLLNWIAAFSKKPKKIFIVHGEGESMNELSRMIGENFRIKTQIPSRGDSYFIGTEEKLGLAKAEEGVPKEYGFIRLDVADYLEKLKEQLEDLTQSIKNYMKEETNDEEVDKLKQKLKTIEDAMANILK